MFSKFNVCFFLKMDLWVFNPRLVVGTLLSLAGVFSLEISVRHTQLKLCEKNQRLCVTDLRDCDLRPPSSSQRTLNMSCYYQETANGDRSVACGWSEESNVQSDASLIFTSGSKVASCQGIFNPAAILSVTVRIKNYETGRETWCQPHRVFLLEAVKPLQPVLTVLGSTEDSVVVSWKSGVAGSCRLRYRPDGARVWSQASDAVAARRDQSLNYTIGNLLPFNAYRAAVACRGKYGFWSDWSSDANGTTLDRLPPRPSEVCYRVEKKAAAGSLLHLRWKAPDPGETEGRVLGYQVSVGPRGRTQNVSETSALLPVEEGDHSVSVQAFNTAGLGPAAHLQVNRKQIILPSIRNLWVSSYYPKAKTLLVQWTSPPSPSSSPSPSSALPVSHVAVEWHSEKRPSSRGGTRVDGSAASAVLQDADPDESYLISVFPVSHQQCGSPQSLTASLQQGALMEPVNLKVVGVTKTTVAIMWAWQQKTGPIRVKGYRAMLRRDSDVQSLSLWPDQRQHSFFNLTPNTEYSLLLLADNDSRRIITVMTDFDEVPAVAAATPLLLLAVAAMIISILSRTLYKSYFFPPISSPRLSSTGQWLMSPYPKKCADRNILDMRDFEVTDILGSKSLLLVCSNDQLSSEDLPEDASPLSLGVQMSAVGLSAETGGDTRPIGEQQLAFLQSYGHVDTDLVCEMEYLTNCWIRTETD
ncbi:interleukin-6 receptor subunit beta [Kryptolebias marmoratus]|uniref:interleukin-6 receptor subunit beta n=1 Tax=Kryptolebias marmoratus TaxID=37003 RepID=UPI0007F93681|nr:interleukin-6 receptor subunit beta [Kryptolebias marmoratus]